MFEKLLHYKSHRDSVGVIWSLEGDHYLAFEMAPSGDILKKAKKPFRSLSMAQDWLHGEGIDNISLRQSSAYFEMIGQASESTLN